MADRPENAATPEAWFGWPWGWRWPMPTAGAPGLNLAPERLWQPVNPGWSFGNVVVNTTNSSAPDVEQSVLSHHSYGRQIGRLMDAVGALADAATAHDAALSDDARIADFRALAADVQRIKQAHSDERLERLRADLLALKASDPQAWKQLLAAVR